MLTRSDGEAGRNFLSPEILKLSRIGFLKVAGLSKNTACFITCSQVNQCAELFGPLVRDQELARTLVEELVPEKISGNPRQHRVVAKTGKRLS